MHDPGLASVLGIHHAAHVGIDDPGHVGRRTPACREQRRRADVERHHGAAHEGAMRRAVFSGHADAERTAHHAAGAVDAQEIARLYARACAALRILDLGGDVVVMRGERRQALAEMHLRTRRAFGAAAQRTFEHDLRDGVGNLRRRPIRIGPRQPAEFVAAETRRSTPTRARRRAEALQSAAHWRCRAGGNAPSSARWCCCISGVARFRACR